MKDRTETKRGQVGIVGFPVNEVGPEEVMFLTVPGPNIKRLALFGVVSGLGIGIFLILIMQNWLGLWTYHQIDFIYLGRLPLLLLSAWTPVEILFAHFLSRYQQPLLRLLLIFFIPGVVVVIHFIQIQNHMLTYNQWNYTATYLVSLAIHFAIALYLKRAKLISDCPSTHGKVI